ncbi:MAG: hypothetical protein ACI90Q_002422 [Nonlabens sp.]
MLIYLSKKIGKMLASKAHKKAGYIAVFVITWIAAEVGGGAIGAVLFPEASIAMYGVAFLGGGAAYFANYFFAKSLPDSTPVDLLNEFGTSQEQ